MLFNRSLLQELASTAVGAFLILFGIVIAQRTSHLVKLAAKGVIPNDAIAVILGFNMIRFLPMLLSVCIFLAILMTLSRWYRDSEMIIWLGSGLSIKSLLKPILLFAAPIVTVILMLSLFITPWANQKVDDYQVQLKSRDEFAAISPGVFKETSNAERVFFIESFDKLGEIVRNVFVQNVQHQKQGIIVAAEGKRMTAENGDNFLVMQNGRRYQGVPNTREYSVTEFKEYALRIEPKEVNAPAPSEKSMSSAKLLSEHNNSNIAELEWRFAMPISALILALLAIPLSALDPRGGKTANSIIALIIYVIYTNMLSIVQAWIAQGKLHPLIGLWPVHLIFFAIAVYMFKRRLDQKPLLPNLMHRFKNKPLPEKGTTRQVSQNKKPYEDSF